MKNILLDHFRRWWWVWGIGIIAVIGMAIGACMPENAVRRQSLFPVILFLGPFLLSFDLSRGHARALLSMPVTVRETARTWWLATVAIPSLVLAILTGLVYALIEVMHPGSVSYLTPLNYWLLNSLLLGVMFFALTGLPSRQGGTGGLNQIRAYIFGGLWGILFGGWYLFNNFVSIEKASGLGVCALAGILTVIGWFRAETMVMERAGLQGLAATSPATAKPWRGREGYGGLRYLLGAVFQRFVLIGLWMFLMCSIFFWLMGLATELHAGSHADSFSFVGLFSFQLLWIMSFQILPVVFHLRVLRTLPVSATQLASLLVFTPGITMLIVVYVANFLLSTAYGSPWFSPMDFFARGYLVQVALACCVIPFLTWRGMDRIGLLIVLFVVMAGMGGAMAFEKEFSSLVVNMAAPILMFGAFLATKYLLERNSRVYRPRNNQTPGWSWSVGR